jgi:lysophospholipase L1-like esterase
MGYTYRLVKGAPLTHEEYDDNFYEVDTQHDAVIAARDLAEQWAEEDEDVEVEAGKYSAKHHALKAAEDVASITTELAEAEAARDAAEGFRDEAEGFRDTAEGYKDAAGISETNAESFAEVSENYAITPEDTEIAPGVYSALHYAAKAEEAELNAESAETGAVSAQGDAETARDKAESWAEEPHGDEVEPGSYSSLHYAVQSASYATTALGAAGDAEDWAEEDEDVEVEAGKYSAKHHAAKAEESATSSESSANLAEDWAEEDEDVEVEAGKYSAKHHAAKADASATAASTSESNASDSAALAEDWAEEAEDVEVEAGKYSAKHHSHKAEDSAIAASNFADNAESWALDAEEAYEDTVGLEIAIIGDSLSAPLMLNKTWGQQLADFCNQAGLRCTVRNWATASHTFYLARTEDVHEGGTRTQVEQCIAHGADIVFVALGINDTVYANTRTENQIIQDAKDVYDDLHAGLPSANIVLVREDPYDTETHGLSPAALDNEDVVPYSHEPVTMNGEDCYANTSDFLTQSISGGNLALHQMWGAVIDDIDGYYDDVVTASMWKFARLGCIIDDYHLDFWGHQLWAFSVLKWLKDNNGVDDNVLDLDLYNTANSAYIDVDDLWTAASTTPANAAHYARYHDLNIHQRMSSWMFKQRGFSCSITPNYARPDHLLTVVMKDAAPDEVVYYAWDAANLASTSRDTTAEGNYSFSFKPHDLGVNTSPGNHTVVFAIENADGSFDAYKETVELFAVPTPALTMGDAFFLRTDTGTQTIANANTFEDINWDTSIESDGDDTATLFTAPVDGIYTFTINLRHDITASTTFYGVGLVINKGDPGAIYHFLPHDGPGAVDYDHISDTHVIKLDADDEVSCCFYQAADDGIELDLENSSYSGYLIRNLE